MYHRVSKFSRVSIFSDLNHLEDLSLKSYSATLVGYTEAEMEHYFSGRITEIAQNQGLSYQELRQQVRLWYNGYSWLGEKVYNPFSVLNYLKSADFDNFWFETGSPSFLIKILNKNVEYDFEDVEADNVMMNSFQIENLHPITLLFQTGYLTIKKRMIPTISY
ncbi:MAG: AAA family ATPase [Richelia sp. RM2_1_2]|nr:AAA family ATPase [Richelia sp. RM2_1_2]